MKRDLNILASYKREISLRTRYKERKRLNEKRFKRIKNIKKDYFNDTDY